MKAIIHKKYGSPEVAFLSEVPKPEPLENQALIKVLASTVNRTDSGFRSAEYFISRFFSGLIRPKNQILGCEFVGEIVQIGARVSKFKVGDKIVAFNDKTFGGHAEFAVVGEDEGIAVAPKNLTLHQCAALTEGSHYALGNIRASKIEKGQHVLVYGATGAIGSAAVQLLKHFGCIVTAVCNTKNIELVRELGADVVIDYQTQDYKKTSQKFDFMFDAVGKSSFKIAKTLLNKKGIYISTELGKNGQNIFYALFTPIFRGRKVLFPIPSTNQEDIIFLVKLAENGEFTPVIDKTYHFSEIVEAYKYVESAQKTGNVILLS